MGSLQDHITIVIEVIISSRNHQLVLIVINVCSYSYNPFIVIVYKTIKPQCTIVMINHIDIPVISWIKIPYTIVMILP